MILQSGLEQACFRCGRWHLPLPSGDDLHPHASRYLYVDCPGRGQFKGGSLFRRASGNDEQAPAAGSAEVKPIAVCNELMRVA
jgi:hypothetical protein